MHPVNCPFLHDRFQARLFAVHVSDMPVGGAERSLRLFLTAHDHEIHHVAQIPKMIVNASRQTVDILAVLIAAALPWSTSLIGIFVVGWLVVLVARCPRAEYNAAQNDETAIPIPTPW